MIQKRNPDVADFITVSLRGRGWPHVEAAARCREGLLEVGFEAPEWGDSARGARPDCDPMVDRLAQAGKGGRRKPL